MSPTTLLWLITGCLMLQPLSTDLYLASLPHLTTYFSTSPAAVQQTLSLFLIGFGTAQLISGPLSDRYGRRPVLEGGLLTYLIASIACALAPSLPMLVVARFVQATGCCTVAVAARAIIRDAHSPAEGARMIAKVSSLLALMPILGPIAGSYLQVTFGWRAAFGVHTLFCALLSLAAWRWLKETNNNPAVVSINGLIRNYARIVATPAFWAYTLPGALSYSSIFVFISGSSYVLIRVLDVPTEYYGYCFSFGVFGYLLGTLVCRRLIGRIGMKQTLTVGASLSLLGGLTFIGLVLLGVHHWTVVLGSLFLTMFAHGINYPCTQSGAVAPFPQQAGAAAALLGFFSMLPALLIGAWLAASVDGTLYPIAYISAANGIALFVAAQLFARHRIA